MARGQAHVRAIVVEGDAFDLDALVGERAVAFRRFEQVLVQVGAHQVRLGPERPVGNVALGDFVGSVPAALALVDEAEVALDAAAAAHLRLKAAVGAGEAEFRHVVARRQDPHQERGLADRALAEGEARVQGRVHDRRAEALSGEDGGHGAAADAASENDNVHVGLNHGSILLLSGWNLQGLSKLQER